MTHALDLLLWASIVLWIRLGGWSPARSPREARHRNYLMIAFYPLGIARLLL